MRIPIGIALLAALFGLLGLDYQLDNGIPFACVVGALVMGGLSEFYALTGVASRGARIAGVLLGGALIAAQWAEYSLGRSGLVGMVAVLGMALLMIGTMLYGDDPPAEGGRPPTHAMAGLLALGGGLIWVWFPLSFLFRLRTELPGLIGVPQAVSLRSGILFVLVVVVVAKSADIGGYLVGKAIGKHKLIPRISAGKSWEGTFGGVALSLLVAVGAVHYLPLGRTFGLPAAALFGALMAPLSLAGDLCESYLKRWAGSKDSNTLIPEFGGVLDVVDSLTFCLPTAYYLLIWFYP
ncbi:phosphatidate cytidylyltransferase [bacterium AH-315-M10]|nr:phosphatidate cytidylyltransferase [bacterium AH-315-M10]